MSFRPDSLIFDVDGTVWDTTPVVKDAWNAALDELGLSYAHVTADRLRGLFGLPMDAIIKDILPDEPDSVRERFRPVCYRYEEEYVPKRSGIVYPHFIETIRTLKGKIPMYVVSNCQSGYIELMIEKTGLYDCFLDHLCYGDTGLLKAENILSIIKKHKLMHPAYVGDTQMDADACKAAGVPIIYCSYGFGKVIDPDLTISDIRQLMDIVGITPT